MRLLIQRVSQASVEANGQITGQIDLGLLIFVGICSSDTVDLCKKMAQKTVNLRIFSDVGGRFTDSLLDIGGSALVVSQFTLCADLKKGRRPSFQLAAAPEHAETLIETFSKDLKAEGIVGVETGHFGAHMNVTLCNQGPVTIWMDSDHFF